MLSLEFEKTKYLYHARNCASTEYERLLLSEAITDYFAAKARLKYSPEIVYDFALKPPQQAQIDRIMLDTAINHQIKLIITDILRQTAFYDNSLPPSAV